MRWDKSKIFAMEKELARKVSKVARKKVRPRPIKIVDSHGAYIMRADPDSLKVDRKFLEGNPAKEEMEENTTHEAIHYAGYCHHDEEFVRLARKLKVLDDYTLKCFLDEARARWNGRMEERLEKNAPERIIIHRKPNWERFRDGVFYESYRIGRPNGYTFRILRERYGLSRREVAKRSGLSEYKLGKIEKNELDLIDSPSLKLMRGKISRTILVDEGILKRIFYVITKGVRYRVPKVFD